MYIAYVFAMEIQWLLLLLLHGQTRILQLDIWSSLPKKVTEANIREKFLINF